MPEMGSFLFSRSFFMDSRTLTLLFAVNFLGTIYGYVWYYNQMVYTHEKMQDWLLLFVPDSPTASLFFSVSILFLFRPPLQSALEALAFVTSLKYGLWAVAMIFAGAYQGNELEWTDWMLTVSHLGMAFEALLYARWFSFRFIHVFGAGLWTLLNDWVDYTYGVFPWLPKPLYDDLTQVEWFTKSLTLAAILTGFLAVWFYRRNQV